MKICVSGLTAVGKTFIAKKIAQAYNIKYISASVLLLDGGLLLGYHSFKPNERRDHFWLTPHADLFNLERLQDHKLDKRIDCLLLNYLDREPGLIADTLTAPFLMPRQNNAFNILILASLEVRAKRAWLSSPTLSIPELMKGVSTKDKKASEILKAAWGIDITSDELSQFYDLVLENSDLDDQNDIAKTGNVSKVITLEAIRACVDMYDWCRGNSDNVSALMAQSKIIGMLNEFPNLFRKYPKVFLEKIDTIRRYDWQRRNENDRN
ncbi:MAG: cytidylate kinase family protein [Candidatus Azambacteria bacterium]|nr:cytidylate kinase family protein [Candidatus Azambacteria bacterium]